jgi:hypothetical protein
MKKEAPPCTIEMILLKKETHSIVGMLRIYHTD